MKIYCVIKEALHIYPPCVSQILMLNDLGIKVIVICGDCDDTQKKIFKEKQIECVILGNSRVNIKTIGKILSWLTFRKKLFGYMKKNIKEKDIIWYLTADTAISMYKKFKKSKYVLSILELYDKELFYKYFLAKIIHNASAVIVCQNIRAQIMKSWWNLKEKPYVMPNKPYLHPQMKKISPSNSNINAIIEKITNKKTILYQGLISPDREICNIALALKKCNSDYYLVLMGKEFYDGISKIKNIYEKTIYVGYIPAPLHLEITSYADIGIANYDYSSLNNIFCAPNKIFEYTGFGMPVLCNDVQGLTETIGSYRAGKCVDFNNIDEIIIAVKDLDNNYKYYSENAVLFYNSVNNLNVIKKIVNNNL